MKLNDDTYYYLFNGQNDVIGLIDSNGTQVVSYTYNSWGKPLSVTDTSGKNVGTKNPFRYRGYCWDEETGLYYVSSRYYDPELGRFISADDEAVLEATSDLDDKNLYAYCDNNPIMREDTDGNFWNIAAGAVIGAAVSAAVEFGFQLVEYATTNGESGFDKNSIIIAAVSGAAGGALTASGIPAKGQVVLNAVLSGGTELYSQVDSGNRNPVSIAVNVGVAAFMGGFTGNDDGVRLRGSVYRNSINNKKIAKKKYKAKNTKRTQKKLYRATKKYKAQRKKVTISTSISYGKGNFWSTVVNRIMGIFKI